MGRTWVLLSGGWTRLRKDRLTEPFSGSFAASISARITTRPQAPFIAGSRLNGYQLFSLSSNCFSTSQITMVESVLPTAIRLSFGPKAIAEIT